MHLAAERGCVAGVKALIEAGAEFNCCSDDGITPLHAAADYGRVEVVQALITAGAALNVRAADTDLDGQTPLHIAAKNGQLLAVQALIQAGADLMMQAEDANHSTALQLAIAAGHMAAAQVLATAERDLCQKQHRELEEWKNVPPTLQQLIVGTASLPRCRQAAGCQQDDDDDEEQMKPTKKQRTADV
eukprot:jgi/Chrzof1/6292/Cz18g00130.t1